MIPSVGLMSVTFLILLWLRLYNKYAFKGEVHIGFPFFVGAGWFLYTFFFILEKVFKGDYSQTDALFILDSNIALIALVTGSFLGQCFHFLTKRTCNSRKLTTKVQSARTVRFSNTFRCSNFVLFLTSAVIATLLHIYIQYVFGGWVLFFTQKYGEFLSEGVNSLTVVIPMVCASFILVISRRGLFESNYKRRFVLLVSLALVLVFFLGGNRNIAMMILLALVWAKFHGKTVNIFVMLPILTVLISVGAVNAVLREYGIISILTKGIPVSADDIIRYMLAISEGEFGTMARVSAYYNEFNFVYANKYGLSYLFDSLVNLLPSMLYHDRPATIAVQFTEQYWGVKSGTEGLIGLGFSPIVEAKINFSELWFLVFLSFGFLLKLLSLYLGNKPINYYCWGALSIVSLNFFRIDFAITFKFFLLIFTFSCFIRFFVDNMSRVKLWSLSKLARTGV